MGSMVGGAAGAGSGGEGMASAPKHVGGSEWDFCNAVLAAFASIDGPEVVEPESEPADAAEQEEAYRGLNEAFKALEMGGNVEEEEEEEEERDEEEEEEEEEVEFSLHTMD